MMRILLSAFLLGVLLYVAPASRAADVEVLSHAQSISDSKYHKVHVEDLKRDFHLLVRPPVGYDPDGWPYPVVYLLDGGMLFPMLGAYYQYLRYQEAVPDVIVVGVSYGASSFDDGNYRGTDFTAPSTERDYYDGAALFQQVFEQQILPLVEKTYNADPDRRVILGQSLGGQFVIFTAMTKPELFSAPIASNPALHANLDYFLKPRHEAGAFSRLMVISGSEDPQEFAIPRSQWLAHWNKEKKLPVELGVREVKGHGHFSIAPEAFRQGLIWGLQP